MHKAQKGEQMHKVDLAEVINSWKISQTRHSFPLFFSIFRILLILLVLFFFRLPKFCLSGTFIFFRAIKSYFQLLRTFLSIWVSVFLCLSTRRVYDIWKSKSVKFSCHSHAKSFIRNGQFRIPWTWLIEKYHSNSRKTRVDGHYHHKMPEWENDFNILVLTFVQFSARESLAQRRIELEANWGWFVGHKMYWCNLEHCINMIWWKMLKFPDSENPWNVYGVGFGTPEKKWERAEWIAEQKDWLQAKFIIFRIFHLIFFLAISAVVFL